MANRDQPVNGKRSTLSLLKSGNLVLTDAGQFDVWSTNTNSSESLELFLHDTGNLILREHKMNGSILWQSFDFPTDTLLPSQSFTGYMKLVSSKSYTNYSSGSYKLIFDNDNLLRLLYDVPQESSIYWPDPLQLDWQDTRSTYNSSRIATLNRLGNFSSSDDFTFKTSDYGEELQRRLTLDFDGNVRVYSRKHEQDKWSVSGQFHQQPCQIHGICGPNSTCSYDPRTGRKCSCLPAFQFRYVKNKGFYNCYPKMRLLNGRHSTKFKGSLFLRLPKNNVSHSHGYNSLVCSRNSGVKQLGRSYINAKENESVKFMLWFASGLGGIEVLCLFLVGWILFKNRKQSSVDNHRYVLAVATGFRKFSYSELKNATKGFSQEIGRGAGGVVYKGVLSDTRVVAIKCLHDANQGESEFLAEVSIIGRLNHMNLIGMWGYCAEGKHRLLVCEYMKNGSLADNLSSNKLDSVDVYSYGVVVLEIIAGKSPTSSIQFKDGEELCHERLVTWVREKRRKGLEVGCWVEQIVDPNLGSNYDVKKMETLANVALDCVAEEKNVRPTMSQVVERLLSHEDMIINGLHNE
ncbi:putative receptor protein kinase ZmPK1 [Trifolium repens]|nr:putative receptor protein kinase ZmPK1 [Trifolium repens]